MKPVLISIRPKWCELIANGKKTIEVRRTKPKIETPFKCYIYETKARSDMPTFVDEDGHVIYTGRGQVIGEFVCDKVITVDCDSVAPFDPETHEYIQDATCLDRTAFIRYTNFRKAFGWLISDLKIYDNPKELNDFATVDKEAIHQCKHRSQSYYAFTDTGYVKNGFICNEKDDWCFGCKRKPIVRPPQSWCYVEELQNV